MGKLSKYRKTLPRYYVNSLSNIGIVKMGDKLNGKQEEEYSYLTHIDKEINNAMKYSGMLGRSIESCGLPMTVSQAFFSSIATLVAEQYQFRNSDRLRDFLVQRLHSVALLTGVEDHVVVAVENKNDTEITVTWVPTKSKIMSCTVGLKYLGLDTNATLCLIEPDWDIVTSIYVQAVFGRQYYAEAAMCLIALFLYTDTYSNEEVAKEIARVIEDCTIFDEQLGLTVEDMTYVPEPAFMTGGCIVHDIDDSVLFRNKYDSNRSLVTAGWYALGETFKQYTDTVATSAHYKSLMNQIRCAIEGNPVDEQYQIKTSTTDGKTVLSDFPGELIRHIAINLTQSKLSDRELYLHWAYELIQYASPDCNVPKLLTSYIDKTNTFGGVKDNG